MSEPVAALARAKRLFDDRKTWESLWDIVYRYVAPERATIFRNAENPNEVGNEVFDSTAIDAAERLVNLLISGLIPPEQRWMRLEPGVDVSDDEAEKLRPLFRLAEDKLMVALRDAGFYQEMQPALLDRTVGGTGGVALLRHASGGLRFRCVPLSDLAVEEDYSGRISCVSYKAKWSVVDLERAYPKKLPQELTQTPEQNKQKAEHTVYKISEIEADGQWRNSTVLDHNNGVELTKSTARDPELLPTRWSRIPGTPYGRGPGLRALSDVRALNKLKELTLKNAAKAVAGVYTAVSDGVLNPFTISFEPGAINPVASNDIQNPPLMELPNTARFDVAQFSMSELVQSIRSIFMADQFGDLSRTPRSATEVAERSRILAQDLGSSISRLQEELILPVVRAVLRDLQRRGEVPAELVLDGRTANVKFLSRLARAQQSEDEMSLIEYATVVAQFGEVDPKAGLVLDVHKALRRVGNLKGIHPDDMRTDAEIDEIMQQAAEAQVQAAEVAPE